jgi:hypothetical protein
MIEKSALGLLVAAGLLTAATNHAKACNKTAGCTMDVIQEDYKMRRDGRMDRAMFEGHANVEAFRALRAAERGYAIKR